MIKFIRLIKAIHEKASIFISTYLLIFVGLIMTSWIIWARFLRERTIRDIPDSFFTEYRFWILFYISCMYFYTVKNLVKPTMESTGFSEILGEFLKICYLPLEKLDHSIKYHILKKNLYHKFINSLVKKSISISSNYLVAIIFSLEILPRIVLVCFLLCDTFYFFHLERFYTVILIGLLPFLYRYIIYSLKNHYEYLVVLLTNVYDLVEIDRTDDDDEEKKKYYYNYYGRYSGKADMKITEEKRKDFYYKKYISVKEYINLKYENHFDYLFEIVRYQYIGHVYMKDEVYTKYVLNKYGNSDINASSEDIERMQELFKELIPEIIELRTFLQQRLDWCKNFKIIKWPKIIIFTLYGISWSFILIISSWYYPVKFIMFKYFIANMELYLLLPEDPFLMIESYSRNLNLVTVKSVISLIRAIWEKISFLK